jgi:hypothetical protein
VVAFEKDRELFDPAVPDVLHDPAVGHRGLPAKKGKCEVFRAIPFTLYNKRLKTGKKVTSILAGYRSLFLSFDIFRIRVIIYI